VEHETSNGMANVERAIQRRGITSDVRGKLVSVLADATCKHCGRRIAGARFVARSVSGRSDETYFFHAGCAQAGLIQERVRRLDLFKPAALQARRSWRTQIDRARRRR
jgi:hypothetical protein